MTLEDYLAREGLSQTEFAQAIGLSEASVSRLVNGLQKPTLDTILTIERVTRNAVKAKDFASA